MMAQDLDSILRFDPLDAAERLTGKSSYETIAVGLVLAQQHAELKREVLTQRGDTTFNDTLPRYLSVIETAGFEKVLEVPFLDDSRETHYENALLIYARRDGLLLSFDTYFGNKSVNSGYLYYHWKPYQMPSRDNRYYSSHTSSGGWHYGIWVGNADCREGLIYHIDRLAANGEFLPKWKEKPFLWLLHYMDAKQPNYDYKAINAERIAMLPSWVQEMIS